MKTTATQNQAWGFYGTLKSNYGVSDVEAAKLFDHAARQLVRVFRITAECARQYLDARDGRHLADHLSFYIGNGAGNHSLKNLKSAMVKALANDRGWVARAVLEYADMVRAQKSAIQNAERTLS